MKHIKYIFKTYHTIHTTLFCHILFKNYVIIKKEKKERWKAGFALISTPHSLIEGCTGYECDCPLSHQRSSALFNLCVKELNALFHLTLPA